MPVLSGHGSVQPAGGRPGRLNISYSDISKIRLLSVTSRDHAKIRQKRSVRVSSNRTAP